MLHHDLQLLFFFGLLLGLNDFSQLGGRERSRVVLLRLLRLNHFWRLILPKHCLEFLFANHDSLAGGDTLGRCAPQLAQKDVLLIHVSAARVYKAALLLSVMFDLTRFTEEKLIALQGSLLDAELRVEGTDTSTRFTARNLPRGSCRLVLLLHVVVDPVR